MFKNRKEASAADTERNAQDPADGAQFLAQLAQFQQLEQSINTGQDISAIRGDLDKLALAPAGTNSTSNT